MLLWHLQTEKHAILFITKQNISLANMLTETTLTFHLPINKINTQYSKQKSTF